MDQRAAAWMDRGGWVASGSPCSLLARWMCSHQEPWDAGPRPPNSLVFWGLCELGGASSAPEPGT